MAANDPRGAQGPARARRPETAPPNGEDTKRRIRALEIDLAGLKSQWDMAKWVVIVALAIGTAYCNDLTVSELPDEAEGGPIVSANWARTEPQSLEHRLLHKI